MTVASPVADHLHGVAAEHFSATSRVADAFFTQRADDIARACQAMASCFASGGRMFVCGDGAQRSDVAHVVVEFVHPVVVGKRALPAFPLPEVQHGAATRSLHTMAQRGDLLLVLVTSPFDAALADLVMAARDQGLVTIALTGEPQTQSLGVDHLFAVPSDDACIVQETHEMLYHILWELVHVFLDHRFPAPGHV